MFVNLSSNFDQLSGEKVFDILFIIHETNIDKGSDPFFILHGSAWCWIGIVFMSCWETEGVIWSLESGLLCALSRFVTLSPSKASSLMLVPTSGVTSNSREE